MRFIGVLRSAKHELEWRRNEPRVSPVSRRGYEGILVTEERFGPGPVRPDRDYEPPLSAQPLSELQGNLGLARASQSSQQYQRFGEETGKEGRDEDVMSRSETKARGHQDGREILA